MKDRRAHVAMAVVIIAVGCGSLASTSAARSAGSVIKGDVKQQKNYDNGADKGSYKLEQRGRAVAGAPIVVLRDIKKELVFSRDLSAEEASLLADLTATQVVFDMTAKGVASITASLPDLPVTVVWPGDFTEENARAFAAGGNRAAMVFDFLPAKPVSDLFLMLQADYFPASMKTVRVTGDAVDKTLLDRLARLRGYNLEIVLNKPLKPAALAVLGKMPTLFKHFIVPPSMTKAQVAGLVKLGNVLVSFDLRASGNLAADMAVVAKMLPTDAKGLVVKGPFDETAAGLFSSMDKLKLLRVEMTDACSPTFVKMLNRQGNK